MGRLWVRRKAVSFVCFLVVVSLFFLESAAVPISAVKKTVIKTKNITVNVGEKKNIKLK